MQICFFQYFFQICDILLRYVFSSKRDIRANADIGRETYLCDKGDCRHCRELFSNLERGECVKSVQKSLL